MSKRNSSMSSSPGGNTLFKYFAKSPAPLSKTPSRVPSTSASNPTPSKTPSSPNIKSKRDIKEVATTPTVSALSDEEDIVADPTRGQKHKRRRIIVDSDSDQENESVNIPVSNDTRKETVIKPAAPAVPRLETSPDNSGAFEKKLKALATNIDKKLNVDHEKANTAMDDEPQQWLHTKLEFMQPNAIKDANGRRRDHPEYDPTTLLVPKSYLETLTPGMRQWWELKSKNNDCVLFFKVGKFYELYHMDADVGVQELGFTYMRGEFAHSGFPEQSYDRMVISLVERGYKVARIEQTETPDMMQERLKLMKKTTKFDKVVCREICQVTNRGTQVFGQQVPLTNSHQANYMLAVTEKHSLNSNRFGVCFIDTSIGEFQLCEFDDDKHCSRLLTLLSHHPPVLVLSPRGSLSARTNQIFKTVLSNTLKEQLVPETQFWNGAKTLKTLAEKYFSSESSVVWPDALRSMQDVGDHLGITPHADWQLALQALGGCLHYLARCMVDLQIMSLARFSVYTLPDDTSASVDLAQMEEMAHKKLSATIRSRNMVLDSISLSNLKITDVENSLLVRLDQCCTKFGKRLLQFWVCTPSCEPAIIRERQEAVRELMDQQGTLQELRMCLSSVPDLERQLAQIHTFGDSKRLKSHPDGRAVLFEQHIYNKKKIQDFISTLNGFDALTKVPNILASCNSTLLRRLSQLEPNGVFPDMNETLDFFRNGFDHKAATTSGMIAPGANVDPEYDSILDDIQALHDEMAEYLIGQEKRFGCRIVYYGEAKKRFQLEIPESNAKRADSSYVLEGQRKGNKAVKRFYTDETKEFLRRMQHEEERRGTVLKDFSRRMFEKFSAKYKLWKGCVDSVGVLDVIATMATYGLDQNQQCFPEILDSVNGPVLELEEGFHPCMNVSDDFIPNGITLGGTMAGLSLLTGPNMGGKSTLMRQVGLLIIMAQMGCPIPAKSCRMTIVDRIFTRLGAQDDILAGHSTFLVELSETATILKHATVNSLVLLDELGRGTATYDGTAIAAAVVNFLADLSCRTLFSTHYHNLVENFHGDGRVSLGHMACMVENEDNDDPTQETVTFLYKYTDGPCPKSYGFNAAKLAGMPNEIIRRAHELSKKVESDALKRKVFSKILSSVDASEIKCLLATLQTLAIA